MKVPIRGAIALVMTVALNAFAQGADIKIGFVAPITGPASDFGNSALLGAKLAISEINEVGGFLGRKLELEVKDDTGVPAVARKQAEALMKENVAFGIAAGSSGSTLAMLDVFQANRKILMVGMATATSIETKVPPRDSYIFRLAASDAVQAEFLVNEIVRKGYSRVAIFADRTGYGEGGYKDVAGYLKAKGIEPVYVARFDVGVPSLEAEMTQAKQARADVIVGYTVGPEQALIATTRKKMKFDVPQYTPWTGSSRVVWERGGAAVNGVVVVQTFVNDVSNERRTSFIARLNRIANGAPIASFMAAAQHYDAIQLMLRAMFQSHGDTSGPALKAVLEDLKRPYAGVVTTHEHPYTPDDHEAFTQNMAWLAVWKNGNLQFLNSQDARRVSYIRRKADPLAH